jgi:hypothetical protein
VLAIVGLVVRSSPSEAQEIAWPNEPPESVPVQNSDRWAGIVFTGRTATYELADTWFPSWSANGDLYSAFADGVVGDVPANGRGPAATIGNAKIIGDDPMLLDVVPVGATAVPPLPFEGRYPSANLVLNDVWYVGTYVLDAFDGPCGSWCALGPFVGFHVSTDLGQTWSAPPYIPSAPLFPAADGLVKLGALHFVDFGRNNEHTPDGKAYLVGHGSEYASGSSNNWIAGDDVYIIRVPPRPDTVNDPTAYAFFAGHGPDGGALWSHDPGALRPLLEWRNQLGVVSITYDAPLRRYLMFISRPSDGADTTGTYDTFLLESEALDGDWRLVHYLRAFGPQAYFVNIPSKFIAPDGLTFWLLYSANFSGWQANPPGSGYGLSLHEVRLRPGTMYVAATLHDKIVVSSLENGRWSFADTVRLPRDADADPAVATLSGDRIAVFVRSRSGALGYAIRDHGVWSHWASVGGDLASPPDVATGDNDRVDVVGRGRDGMLRHIVFDGTWSAWESLGGHVRGKPAVASWGRGRLDVFARGRRGVLLHRVMSDGAWSPQWENLGGHIVGGVAAVSPFEQRIDVVARVSGGGAVRRSFDARSGWSPWEDLGGHLRSGPSIAATSSRRALVVGTVRCPVHRQADAKRCSEIVVRLYDGAWSDWTLIGQKAAGGLDAASAR